MAYRGGFGFGFGFGLTYWVQRLLIANVVVFLVQAASRGAIDQYLAFTPALILYRPWTLLTYMFVHNGIFHLLVNMIGLFFFGPPLESRWGSDEFLKYYLICGLGGAALSFLFAWNASIVGASAAVYGIMLAFAMNWPDTPIYIWGILPVPAKYLVVFLALISLYAMIGGARGNIAHAAHLGGFAAGFLYLKLDRPGGVLRGLRKRLEKRRLHVVSGSSAPRPAGRALPPRPPVQNAAFLNELDRILDKISTKGMSSLTAEERRILDEASRKYRSD